MSNLTEHIRLSAEVSAELAGKRLDQALALLFPAYSRSRLKEWVDNEKVMVNGLFKRPRTPVVEGDQLEINATIEVLSDWVGEPIALDIVYEDEHLLVINKPANLVVHPAVGNWVGTLVNALLHHCPALSQIPRAGVVHRLDKDTTGLMVLAKTLGAHTSLVNQLQARTVKRIYEAVVYGVILSGNTINAPIGRHPHDRIRMAVLESGKTAITHYRVIEKFKAHTHLRVQLETGRTHQIRVHLAHIQHPIIGDKMYGGRLRLPPKASLELQTCLKEFPRQALHARSLTLIHPETGVEMQWEVPLPEDMQQLLSTLRSVSE
jgi:23S rRNA pseudouridine1911/1915/1917 synthase